MRIGNNFGISQLIDQMKTLDPFELNLQVTELKMEKQEGEQITSRSLCTPGCGVTGTGNSFCCHR